MNSSQDGVSDRFWERKSLDEMSREEWESLCDGCGRCCLVKLEDADTGEVHLTRAACHLLDTDSCRCMDYQNRELRVPGCVVLRPDTIEELYWLPDTCAYRLLKEGKSLYEWHPLLAGDVHSAGISVRSFAVPEQHIHPDQLEEMIID